MSETTASQGPPERGGVGSVGWAIGVAVVVLGLGLLWWSAPPPPVLERGGEAPGFDLPLLGADGSVSLADYRGRVVLVNFWATWCRPCEEEIPAMERLYRSLSPDGFEILAISVDAEQSDVERFRDRLGISFPILLDPEQEVSRRYQTTGFPESLLVDVEGQVIERYIGPRDWDHSIFAERIREVMARAPAS